MQKHNIQTEEQDKAARKTTTEESGNGKDLAKQTNMVDAQIKYNETSAFLFNTRNIIHQHIQKQNNEQSYTVEAQRGNTPNPWK